MSTELRKLMMFRIEEAEGQCREWRTLLKATTAEIRELKSLLSKHDRVVKALPKELFTRARKGGQRSAASGESAKPAETSSI